MGFASEYELLQTFIWSVSTEWPVVGNPQKTYLEVEPKGLFGIPDLVISIVERSSQTPAVVHTLAFEMKLSKWNKALTQAFRYRSFANVSYVVLDRDRIKPALLNIHQFICVNVGLLSIDPSGEVRCHFDPPSDLPYSERLTTTLENRVRARFAEATPPMFNQEHPSCSFVRTDGTALVSDTSEGATPHEPQALIGTMLSRNGWTPLGYRVK